MKTIDELERKGCDTNEFTIAHLLHILSVMYRQAGQHGGHGGTEGYASNVGSIVTNSFYLIAPEMLMSIIPQQYIGRYKKLKQEGLNIVNFQMLNSNELIRIKKENLEWLNDFKKSQEQKIQINDPCTTLCVWIARIYDNKCIETKAGEYEKKLKDPELNYQLSMKIKITDDILFKFLLDSLPKITRQNLKVSLELMNYLKLDQYIEKLLQGIKDQNSVEEVNFGIEFINSTNIGMIELIFTEKRTKSFILDIFTNNNQIPFFSLLLNLNEDKLDFIMDKAEKVMKCSHAVQGMLRLQSNNAFGTPARLEKLNKLYLNAIMKSIEDNKVTDNLIDLFKKEDINDALIKIANTIIKTKNISLLAECLSNVGDLNIKNKILKNLDQNSLNLLIVKMLSLEKYESQMGLLKDTIPLLEKLNKQALQEIMNQITPDSAANNLMFFSQNTNIWQIEALLNDSMNKTIEKIKSDKEFCPNIFKGHDVKISMILWNQISKRLGDGSDIRLIECLNKSNQSEVKLAFCKDIIFKKFFIKGESYTAF